MNDSHRNSPTALFFSTIFFLGSIAVTIHGICFQKWWGSMGLVLLMTSLIVVVAARASANRMTPHLE
jgi:hypothetical protein